MAISNNQKLFENEDLTNRQKYIEKFQEVLYKASEPTQDLIKSLNTQSKDTLLELRDDLNDIIDNNPESNKYALVLSFINKILDA